MNMVEKVARAIALNEGGRIIGPGKSRATRELGWKGDGEHFDKFVEAHWREYEMAARFAIEAMRELTPEMTDMHPRFVQKREFLESYRAMIDAALAVGQSSAPER